jgi:L-ascorbate metabolism protein UlaG (beta-lactamase superfamily)
MIEPLLRDEAFLRDLAAAPRRADRFSLWWLGQSGFLLQWQQHRLVLDPYLSDSLTRKYAGTARPHERISRRVVDPAALDGVELVTSTHAHTDHLDGATLEPLLSANPAARLVLARATLAIARERLPAHVDRFVPLDAGEETTVGVWTVAAVPAAHETVEQDEAGWTRCLGFVVRFGGFAIYHAGDTVRYEGQADRLRRERLDLALLPINGRDPARGVPGNLSGEEAAALAHDSGARLAVPCHYDLFAFNTASPAPFVRAAAAVGQPVAVLRLGEGLQVPLTDGRSGVTYG